jgi:hypothetical protein
LHDARHYTERKDRITNECCPVKHTSTEMTLATAKLYSSELVEMDRSCMSNFDRVRAGNHYDGILKHNFNSIVSLQNVEKL